MILLEHLYAENVVIDKQFSAKNSTGESSSETPKVF